MGTTLLLAFNFPPLGGGIARWMGELALRYPPRSLLVSTGRHGGSDASDPRFPQPIDHVAIRATRLRTLNGLALWTARQLLGGAAVVVANSRWTADLARSVLSALGRPALARDVRVVPLGTTPSHFRPGIDPRPVRAKYGLDGGPWLLTVSRLDTHKGIDTVIRALPAVRAAFPAVRYAVAGVGSRGPEFARLAAELGLEDAVKFLGFVADAELPAVYNAADLYVGASRRYDLLAEGFGIALVEASACGLAVVAGDSGGVADAVRDGETGILVDPDDPAAVAAGITRLLADDAARRRMGAAGRRAVETRYNWDRVAADVIRIDGEFRRGPPLGAR